MNATTRKTYDELWEGEDTTRYNALVAMIALLEKPVDWAYEVWDDLVAKCSDKDNHVRARATQLLSGLAKSDPEVRIVKALPSIVLVTHDKMFVTARHTIQAMWKIGLGSPKARKALLSAYATRFEDSVADKQCKMIRSDISIGLRRLFDESGDVTVKKTALALIETEPDAAYKKKYLGAWRGVAA